MSKIVGTALTVSTLLQGDLNFIELIAWLAVLVSVAMYYCFPLAGAVFGISACILMATLCYTLKQPTGVAVNILLCFLHIFNVFKILKDVYESY